MRVHDLNAFDELDRLILAEYPYPIAGNYKRLLDEQDWEKKTRICIQIFEFGVRFVTLSLIQQYLVRDADKISDPLLNHLLLTRLSSATPGTWNEIFFRTLQAYQGRRHLFFMPELYDFYWDTSTSPDRPHRGIRAPFDRLIQMRNDLAHGLPPRDEAGWQALGEESVSLLRQVFGHFTFLENYDLIRIVGEEGEQYWYDIYTGLQVTSPSQPLTAKEDLTEGWFYLFRQETRFLELHPLLIFWEKELAEAERERMHDAALFDRFRRSSVDYLATVLGERINLTDRTLIAEFIHTVYYTIEQVKRARREARKLNWWLLKDVAEKVSLEWIGDARRKYYREVYLQREQTKQAFEEFLASDKTCLVLTGKSGVGKSSFFLSLIDEYRDSDQVCILLYNGARLSAETGVAEALTHDFELHLTLEGLTEEEGIRDILFEVNGMGGIADKRVVLLIDALNENPDAVRLLRQIDGLVESCPYPWFKVVLSSRTQSWRVMKRGVRLAEHRYYREVDEEALGIELSDIGIEIPPFSVDEAAAAYEKYQIIYNLQTPFANLPDPLRSLFRDPLLINLIAKVYHDSPIPFSLDPAQLVEVYASQLTRDERLYQEDIVFLERELMSLMISGDWLANQISFDQIATARTSSGRSLFEMVFSDEILSSGRRVNESFTNLVDAQILDIIGDPLNSQIVFKYEFFYDYFVGRRIFELVRSAVITYPELAEQVLEKPFLANAISYALVLEGKKGNVAPIGELLEMASPIIQGVASEALGKVRASLAQLEDWPRLERIVSSALCKLGAVSIEHLDAVPTLSREEALARYALEHPDYSIEFREGTLQLIHVTSNVKKVLSQWHSASVQQHSGAAQFEATVTTLIKQISLAFGTKVQRGQPSRDWFAWVIDTSQAFRDTKLPLQLPIVFPRRSTFGDREVESLRLYLSQRENLGVSSRIALLGLFCDHNEFIKAQELLTTKMRQVYAYDVIAFGPSELCSVFLVKDQAHGLRRLLLSQVDLLTLSPFTITGPAPDHVFFGREPELREISDTCGEISYAIVGGRRIGKTSIMGRLHRVRLPAAGFWAVYHDCSTTPTRDVFLTTPIRDWRPEPPLEVLATFGDLLQSPPTNKPLVLLLDEADKLISTDRAAGWPLFNALRALTISGRAQIVLSGERMLRKGLQDSSGPLFNFANEMLIGRLDFHAVEELVTQPIKQLEIELVDEAGIVQRIWDFTSGHPNVVQRLCRRLIERLNERGDRRITLDDVEAVIEDPDFVRRDFLATYFSRASVLEHLGALLMAADADLRTLTVIHQALASRQIEVILNQVDDALERLVDLRNILKRTAEGYDFAVTAFPLIVSKLRRLDDLIALRREIYQQAGDIDPETAPPEFRGRLW